MTNEPQDADQLARQRQQDLDNIRERDYARGVRDAQRDSTLFDHGRRLDVINGSLVDIAQTQRSLERRLGTMETARGEEVAVNKALGDYLKESQRLDIEREASGDRHRAVQVTSRTLVLTTLAVIISVVVPIIVAIIVSR